MNGLLQWSPFGCIIKIKLTKMPEKALVLFIVRSLLLRTGHDTGQVLVECLLKKMKTLRGFDPAPFYFSTLPSRMSFLPPAAKAPGSHSAQGFSAHRVSASSCLDPPFLQKNLCSLWVFSDAIL